MEINLLLRLIIAHLITDFVLQPKSWITDREEKQGKSKKLYLHVTVTTIVAYLFAGRFDNWIIPLVIFSSHLLIDYLKSKTAKDNFGYFITDQAAHLFVIVLLWLCIENNWNTLQPFAQQITNSYRFWVIATGYVFVSWPLGIIIGKATQKWRDQITRENVTAVEHLPLQQETEEPSNGEAQTVTPEILKKTEEQELGLASAGKWIGICERVLILTFVLMSQFTAIGFLMTAKSILRFSEKENNTQLKTEYVLVGTLVSFASSAMVGVLIQITL